MMKQESGSEQMRRSIASVRKSQMDAMGYPSAKIADCTERDHGEDTRIESRRVRSASTNIQGLSRGAAEDIEGGIGVSIRLSHIIAMKYKKAKMLLA